MGREVKEPVRSSLAGEERGVGFYFPPSASSLELGQGKTMSSTLIRGNRKLENRRWWNFWTVHHWDIIYPQCHRVTGQDRVCWLERVREDRTSFFLYSGLSSQQTAGIGDLISVIKYNLNIRFLENWRREKYFRSIKDLNITSGERHYLCSPGETKSQKMGRMDHRERS